MSWWKRLAVWWRSPAWGMIGAGHRDFGLPEGWTRREEDRFVRACGRGGVWEGQDGMWFAGHGSTRGGMIDGPFDGPFSSALEAMAEVDRMTPR